MEKSDLASEEQGRNKRGGRKGNGAHWYTTIDDRLRSLANSGFANSRSLLLLQYELLQLNFLSWALYS